MRRQILEDIRDAIASDVIHRDGVFINRGIDADGREPPIVNINSISEEVERFDQNPKSYKRNFLLTVECLVNGDDFEQAHERLEDLTEMVEQAIESSNKLNSREMQTNLTRVEFEYESGGESPIAVSILYYNVEREIPAELEPDKLRSLNSIHIEWKLPDNNEDDAVDAKDEINNLND